MLDNLHEFLQSSYSNDSLRSRTLCLRTKNVLQKDFLEASFSIVRKYLAERNLFLGNEAHYAGL